MTKIVRRPDFAGGGITPEEKTKLDAVADFWIKNAFKTDRIDCDKIGDAIRGLYRASNLEEPRVVVVSSPFVAAAVYGAASAIWHATDAATDAATYDATDAATRAATYDATDAATYAATYDATDAATRAATYDADINISAAFRACQEIAGSFGLRCATKWWRAYQGGNMWSHWCAHISGSRDVLGLRLKEHENYYYFEQASIHGGFRMLHEKFCVVSDFPEVIKLDENNQAHCENGPSHKWRDGCALYHWHGVRVPSHWIESPETTDPNEVLRTENVEQRAAGCAILGWPRMAEKLERKVIDGDPNTDIGALIELKLDGLPEAGRFLQAVCPRNGVICEGVPRVSDIDDLPIETVAAAQAWRDCIPSSEYEHSTNRT